MTNHGKTHVGVVGNDELRSLGLVSILDEIPNVAARQVGLTDVYASEGFELLLLDTREPLDSILQMLTRLRRDRPSVRCIVMTTALSLDEIQSVIGAGAKGFLLESAGISEIGMAIGIVQDGSIWAPRKVMARLVEAGASVTYVSPQIAMQQPIEELLTEREREVLHLLMSGRSNREIGAAMGIEQATVKAHLGRMLRKSRATNRVELTLRAMEERETSAGGGAGGSRVQ
ncbi:MAG: response regulator transcription factor [Acidobacteria bacterium]|nr:response regulator transcription factor [Acidobacteriota bacterium]